MKSLLILLTVVGLSVPAFAEHQVMNVSVNGMVCDFCAQGIHKQFEKEAAVSRVEVSLENKLVKIKLKHAEKLSEERVRELLKDAGFEVTGIKVEGV